MLTKNNKTKLIATFSPETAINKKVMWKSSDEKIVKVLEEMAGIFKVLLGILCSLSVMLIIGITLVIKISNSGMMYR